MTEAMLPEIMADTERSDTFVRFSIKMERRQAECPKHGTYEQFGRVLAGEMRWSACPACEAEREAQERANRQRDARRDAAMVNMEGLFSSSGVPVRYKDASFESYTLFPVGHQWHDLQSDAWRACKDYAANFKTVLTVGGNLILRGNSGTGKTHLSCAIVNEVIRQGYSAQFTDTSSIVRAIKAGLSYSANQKADQIIDKLVQVDLLVVDEFEEFHGDEARHHLMDVVNARYAARKPMVVITNLTPDELTKLVAARTVDRLRENGYALSFQWESYRKKVMSMPAWRRSA